MLVEMLLPGAGQLFLNAWSIEEESVVLTVSAEQKAASCPDCGVFSSRVNSRYMRTLKDLPFADRAMQLRWIVRRYFCDNPDCRRITFAEQLPEVAVRYARKTTRLTERQREIAFEVGGEMGQRVLGCFKIHTSGDQILRLIQGTADATLPPPRVLGVDDWAMRKGHTYGTILVDLERHRVVDLLPDREGETLAEWLRAHPSVEIVSRDRSQTYIDAITQGAPGVIQVADRFHLLHNLYEAAKRVFERRGSELREAGKQIAQVLADQNETSPSQRSEVQDPSPSNEPSVVLRSLTYRETLFAAVKELQQQGLSRRAIEKRLGVNRKTVSRYFNLESLPKRNLARQTTSKVTPYLPYLARRWTEGCHNRKQLFDELKRQGFSGSYSSIWRAIAKFPTAGKEGDMASLHRGAIRPWSPRHAAWLLMRKPDTLTAGQEIARDVFCSKSKAAAEIYPLVQAFCQMVRGQKKEKLDNWLDEAESSGLPEFQRFAKGLRNDYRAVQAALTLPWSNAQVEGQVHRLKLIKRQMYGRASFGLLRQRVLGMPTGP